jgi:hypothetical protein
MFSRNRSPQPVEVVFYSGYRGRETPRRIIRGDKVYPVIRVISRERVHERGTGRTLDVFRCEIEIGTVLLRVPAEGTSEMVAAGTGDMDSPSRSRGKSTGKV